MKTLLLQFVAEARRIQPSREARRKFLSVAMACALAFGPTAVALAQQSSDTAGAPTTTENVQPTYHAGNPVCWDFSPVSGNWLHAKYNVYSPKDPNQNQTWFNNGTYNVEGGSITVSNFDGKFFDFSTQGLTMYAVFVKGGNGGSLFSYPNGTKLDTRLHGPLAPNGRYRDISHVSFCYIPDDGPRGELETAFAYGGGTNALDGDTTTCFLNAGQTSRWGWSMGPLGEGTYVWDIYAAAGGCDLSKGTKVGTVTVEYAGGTVTVTYNLPNGFNKTHTYVGSTMFPIGANGQPTVAPGQYTTTGGAGTTDTFTFTGISGPIYVIAHAEAYVP
jgi:hypothetical protein